MFERLRMYRVCRRVYAGQGKSRRECWRLAGAACALGKGL